MAPNSEQRPVEPPQCTVRQGRNFLYSLPSGWRVVEEGNYALFLQAADQSAGIVVAGLSGLTTPLNPGQFAQHILTTVLRIPPGIQFGAHWQLQPSRGYSMAEAFELRYGLPGAFGVKAMRGLAFSNVALTYAACSGVIHLAAAPEEHWANSADWLPAVALQAINNGPNAYGAWGVAAGDRYNQARENLQFQNYLSWSEQTWASVAAHRAASHAYRSAALDPILTGQQWNADPWGYVPTRDSIAPAVIWVHQDGRRFESPDPSMDPRTPSDPDWRRVDR
jgi:hypothetical protein